MPGIAIVTDSSACIPAELVQQNRISVVPVAILFGTVVHRDGDLPSGEFYRRLRDTRERATTAAPTPGEFLEAFRRSRDEGASAVLCLTLSSRFSGTHSSAVNARDLAASELADFPILVVDTGGIAMEHGFAVLAAARAAASGATLTEAAGAAESATARANLVGLLDTTLYLARSGRVPWILHWAASLLRIKPVIAHTGGRIGAIGRVRTTERGIERMVSYVEKSAGPGASLAIALMHAGAPERAQELAECVRQRLAPRELLVTEFTNAMAVHAGEGFLGLAWHTAAPAPQVAPVEARRSSLLQRDVKSLAGSLGPLPVPLERPALVVLSGLPGSGKSHLARELSRRYSFAVLESDSLRKALVKRPTYSQKESGRLFSACHALLEDLLDAGVSALLDATNLKESHRRPLYRIAERTGARLLLVEVRADQDVVRERFACRATSDNPRDRSDATLDVYESMRREAEPIERSHLTVDTSTDIGSVVDRIVGELVHARA